MGIKFETLADTHWSVIQDNDQICLLEVQYWEPCSPSIIPDMKTAKQVYISRTANWGHERNPVEALHRLWSEAAGKPGYDKQDWIALQKRVEG